MPGRVVQDGAMRVRFAGCGDAFGSGGRWQRGLPRFRRGRRRLGGARPLALRVDLGGASFAYSGDSQWTPALAEAARAADLFAVEAYTFDRPIRYHLDYQTLRAHLGEIHAERVVLTHMSTAMLSRLADAELPAAYDGMVVDL